MSLGLLARDSIANLEFFGKDPESIVPTPIENGNGVFCAAQVTAPPDNNGISNQISTAGGSFGSVLASQASSSGKNTAMLASLAVARRQQQPQQQKNPEKNQLPLPPLQATEANPQQPPSFHYAGYTEDYYSSFDAYADQDFLVAPHLLAPKSSEFGGLWSCLFPWMKTTNKSSTRNQSSLSTNPQHHTNLPIEQQQVQETDNAVATTDEDSRASESTNSHVLGERLSDKDRQAVLARLRLAQPESIQNSPHASATHTMEQNVAAAAAAASKQNDGSEKISRGNKGLLSGISNYDTSLQQCIETADRPKLKGILKTRSSTKIDDPVSGKCDKSDDSKGSATGASVNVQKPRRSLFPSYEDRKPRTTANTVTFAPMAKVVTVKSKSDMAEDEKGDVWWQRTDYEDFRKAGRIITRAMHEGGSEIWLAFTDSSFKKNSKEKTTSKSGAPLYEVAGDKWWHKFGHSRRGLEHVVSIDEGRQRQVNVKNAIRAVVEEQSRQKMYKKVDQEKLRMVALQHTSWARDLALASGASDADAVESAFAEGRRSREFYLLKMSRNKPPNAVINSPSIPQFMKPVMEVALPSATMVQHHLDAHTSTQIQFRRQKGSAPQVDSTAEMESVEQLRDHLDEKGKESMAQQAAGFSADGNKVNMAAVLSGMGAVRVKNDEEKLPVMRVVS